MEANLYEDKLSIDKRTYKITVAFHLNRIMCVMHGEEGYALLFTIRPQDVKKVAKYPDISMPWLCNGSQRTGPFWLPRHS